MKNQSVTAVILCVLLMGFYACSEPTETSGSTESPEPTEYDDGSIEECTLTIPTGQTCDIEPSDSATAYSNIEKWGRMAKEAKIPDSLAIVAFEFPVHDIKRLIYNEEHNHGEEGELEHVRGYVALDEETGQFHLYMVGVKEGQESNRIYDLITPCPNTCDLASPLYTSFQNGYNPPR